MESSSVEVDCKEPSVEDKQSRSAEVQRKAAHNEVERRRKGLLKMAITKLGQLLPPDDGNTHMLLSPTDGNSRMSTLETLERAAGLIKDLKDQILKNGQPVVVAEMQSLQKSLELISSERDGLLQKVISKGIQIPPPWKTKSAEHTAATTGDITTTKSADTSSSRKNKKSSRRQNTVSAQLERKAKERELRQKQKETLIKLLSQNGIVVLPGQNLVLNTTHSTSQTVQQSANTPFTLAKDGAPVISSGNFINISCNPELLEHAILDGGTETSDATPEPSSPPPLLIPASMAPSASSTVLSSSLPSREQRSSVSVAVTAAMLTAASSRVTIPPVVPLGGLHSQPALLNPEQKSVAQTGQLPQLGSGTGPGQSHPALSPGTLLLNKDGQYSIIDERGVPVPFDPSLEVSGQSTPGVGSGGGPASSSGPSFPGPGVCLTDQQQQALINSGALALAKSNTAVIRNDAPVIRSPAPVISAVAPCTASQTKLLLTNQQQQALNTFGALTLPKNSAGLGRDDVVAAPSSSSFSMLTSTGGCLTLAGQQQQALVSGGALALAKNNILVTGNDKLSVSASLQDGVSLTGQQQQALIHSGVVALAKNAAVVPGLDVLPVSGSSGTCLTASCQQPMFVNSVTVPTVTSSAMVAAGNTLSPPNLSETCQTLTDQQALISSAILSLVKSSGLLMANSTPFPNNFPPTCSSAGTGIMATDQVLINSGAFIQKNSLPVSNPIMSVCTSQPQVPAGVKFCADRGLELCGQQVVTQSGINAQQLLQSVGLSFNVMADGIVPGNNVLVPTSVGAMVTVSAAPSQSLGSSPAIVLSAGHALSAARAGQVPVSMATENTTNSVTSDQQTTTLASQPSKPPQGLPLSNAVASSGGHAISSSVATHSSVTVVASTASTGATGGLGSVHGENIILVCPKNVQMMDGIPLTVQVVKLGQTSTNQYPAVQSPTTPSSCPGKNVRKSVKKPAVQRPIIPKTVTTTTTSSVSEVTASSSARLSPVVSLSMPVAAPPADEASTMTAQSARKNKDSRKGKVALPVSQLLRSVGKRKRLRPQAVVEELDSPSEAQGDTDSQRSTSKEVQSSDPVGGGSCDENHDVNVDGTLGTKDVETRSSDCVEACVPALLEKPSDLAETGKLDSAHMSHMDPEEESGSTTIAKSNGHSVEIQRRKSFETSSSDSMETESPVYTEKRKANLIESFITNTNYVVSHGSEASELGQGAGISASEETLRADSVETHTPECVETKRTNFLVTDSPNCADTHSADTVGIHTPNSAGTETLVSETTHAPGMLEAQRQYSLEILRPSAAETLRSDSFKAYKPASANTQISGLPMTQEAEFDEIHATKTFMEMHGTNSAETSKSNVALSSAEKMTPSSVEAYRLNLVKAPRPSHEEAHTSGSVESHQPRSSENLEQSPYTPSSVAVESLTTASLPDRIEFCQNDIPEILEKVETLNQSADLVTKDQDKLMPQIEAAALEEAVMKKAPQSKNSSTCIFNPWSDCHGTEETQSAPFSYVNSHQVDLSGKSSMLGSQALDNCLPVVGVRSVQKTLQSSVPFSPSKLLPTTAVRDSQSIVSDSWDSLFSALKTCENTHHDARITSFDTMHRQLPFAVPSAMSKKSGTSDSLTVAQSSKASAGPAGSLSESSSVYVIGGRSGITQVSSGDVLNMQSSRRAPHISQSLHQESLDTRNWATEQVRITPAKLPHQLSAAEQPLTRQHQQQPSSRQHQPQDKSSTTFTFAVSQKPQSSAQGNVLSNVNHMIDQPQSKTSLPQSGSLWYPAISSQSVNKHPSSSGSSIPPALGHSISSIQEGVNKCASQSGTSSVHRNMFHFSNPGLLGNSSSSNSQSKVSQGPNTMSQGKVCMKNTPSTSRPGIYSVDNIVRQPATGFNFAKLASNMTPGPSQTSSGQDGAISNSGGGGAVGGFSFSLTSSTTTPQSSASVSNLYPAQVFPSASAGQMISHQDPHLNMFLPDLGMNRPSHAPHFQQNVSIAASAPSQNFNFSRVVDMISSCAVEGGGENTLLAQDQRTSLPLDKPVGSSFSRQHFNSGTGSSIGGDGGLAPFSDILPPPHVSSKPPPPPQLSDITHPVTRALQLGGEPSVSSAYYIPSTFPSSVGLHTPPLHTPPLHHPPLPSFDSGRMLTRGVEPGLGTHTSTSLGFSGPSFNPPGMSYHKDSRSLEQVPNFASSGHKKQGEQGNSRSKSRLSPVGGLSSILGGVNPHGQSHSMSHISHTTPPTQRSASTSQPSSSSLGSSHPAVSSSPVSGSNHPTVSSPRPMKRKQSGSSQSKGSKKSACSAVELTSGNLPHNIFENQGFFISPLQQKSVQAGNMSGNGASFLANNIFGTPSHSLTNPSTVSNPPSADLGPPYPMFPPPRPQTSLGINFQPPFSMPTMTVAAPVTSHSVAVTPHVSNFSVGNMFQDVAGAAGDSGLKMGPLKFHGSPIIPPPQAGVDPKTFPHSHSHHGQSSVLPNPFPSPFSNTANPHRVDGRSMEQGIGGVVGPPPFHGAGHPPSFTMSSALGFASSEDPRG